MLAPGGRMVPRPHRCLKIDRSKGTWMNQQRVLQGRCLCGAITVELRGAPGPLMFCHCAQCRRSSGAAALAVLPIAAHDFHLGDPEGVLRGYEASPGKSRHFCGRCGSPVYSRRDGDATVRVRAGLLDLPADIPRGGHIFCASAAPWDDARDALPRHARYEPGRAHLDQERNEK